MHYKNNRPAANGDPGVGFNYNGKVTAGVVHNLQENGGVCNGDMATLIPGGVLNLTCRDVGQMYHAEDAFNALESKMAEVLPPMPTEAAQTPAAPAPAPTPELTGLALHQEQFKQAMAPAGSAAGAVAAILLALAMLLFAGPVKADPISLVSLPVSGIPAVGNATGVTVVPAATNIGAVFNITPNANVLFQYTYQINGTNLNPTASAIYNFTDGDGNWTTGGPLTNTVNIGTNWYTQPSVSNNTVTASVVLSYTNFVGMTKGRFDQLVIVGATNVQLTAHSIAQKTVLPF